MWHHRVARTQADKIETPVSTTVTYNSIINWIFICFSPGPPPPLLSDEAAETILSDPHFRTLLHKAKCVICPHDIRKFGETATIVFLSNVGTIQLHYWMVPNGDCGKKRIDFLDFIVFNNGENILFCE